MSHLTYTTEISHHQQMLLGEAEVARQARRPRRPRPSISWRGRHTGRAPSGQRGMAVDGT
jgi:hypothetical protein